jgi:hypothetical protein
MTKVLPPVLLLLLLLLLLLIQSLGRQKGPPKVSLRVRVITFVFPMHVPCQKGPTKKIERAARDGSTVGATHTSKPHFSNFCNTRTAMPAKH